MGSGLSKKSNISKKKLSKKKHSIVKLPRGKKTSIKLPPNITGKHLIVDDAADNRTILKGYLKRTGVSADEASNGLEALDKDLTKYDVIWMDLRMPIMDGIECTKNIRKTGNKIIIIAVTGDTSPYTGKLCRENGFSMLLFKPILRSDVENMKIMQQYK